MWDGRSERTAALVATPASVGALPSLGRAIATGSVLCARHAAMPLAAFGSLARAAAMRGADVTLIHGATAQPPVKFTTEVPVTTAQDLNEAVTDRFDTTDVLIMAAAVADYRPATVADDKIKKKEGGLSIPVERTEDILGTIGPRKTHQFLCGFSMEPRALVENSSAKLAKKNLDMVVASNLKVAGAGFGVDTNVVTFITPAGTRELPLMS